MKYAFALAVLFALSGCASVLPKGAPAPAMYTLNAPVVTQDKDMRMPVSLRILMPQAAPGLETDRIALRSGDNQIDYYNGVRWAGPVTGLMQSLLVQSFDSSRALDSVSNDLVAIKGDYSLLVELQDFQAEYKKGSALAHIRLSAKLIRIDQNRIVTTLSYNETEAATANTVQAIVGAFDSAWHRASSRLVGDILSAIQRNQPSSVKNSAR